MNIPKRDHVRVLMYIEYPFIGLGLNVDKHAIHMRHDNT